MVIWDNLAKFTSLEGKTLLDFGCGEGVLSIYFAKRKMKVTAADISPDKIFRAGLRARENGVDIETCLINEKGLLPSAADGQFDIILCHTVIEHCADPEATLSELKRALKKDGLIYLTTSNRLGLGQFFSDAHYQLPLFSVLPKSLGDWMVKRYRGMENEVAHQFTTIGLSMLYKKFGLEVIYSYPHEVLEKIAKPEKIVSLQKKKVFSILNALKFTWVLRPLMPAIHLFADSLVYILKKRT